MTLLSAFGLFAVTAMLVCYALEHRSSWFILAFAFSCGLGSAYGFLQGAGRLDLSKQSGPALQYEDGGPLTSAGRNPPYDESCYVPDVDVWCEGSDESAFYYKNP